MNADMPKCCSNVSGVNFNDILYQSNVSMSTKKSLKYQRCVLREWILALFARERFILYNCSGSVVLLIFILLEKKGQKSLNQWNMSQFDKQIIDTMY
jgi:hypothetical protein